MSRNSQSSAKDRREHAFSRVGQAGHTPVRHDSQTLDKHLSPLDWACARSVPKIETQNLGWLVKWIQKERTLRKTKLLVVFFLFSFYGKCRGLAFSTICLMGERGTHFQASCFIFSKRGKKGVVKWNWNVDRGKVFYAKATHYSPESDQVKDLRWHFGWFALL